MLAERAYPSTFGVRELVRGEYYHRPRSRCVEWVWTTSGKPRRRGVHKIFRGVRPRAPLGSTILSREASGAGQALPRTESERRSRATGLLGLLPPGQGGDARVRYTQWPQSMGRTDG